MKTGEISDLIKQQVGPAGDLYLTRAKTGDLIRWLEITEKLWNEQSVLVKELQGIIGNLKSIASPGGHMKSLIAFITLLFLFSGNVRADESGTWFCEVDTGKRMGNVYWSCGMHSDLDESGARLGALKDALYQFDLICEASSDCARKPRTVEPRRSSCKQLKNGLWSCSRLIVVTLLN